MQILELYCRWPVHSQQCGWDAVGIQCQGQTHLGAGFPGSGGETPPDHRDSH